MPFTEDAIRFLRDLEENNDREWFQPRKLEYEETVRLPMTEMVRALNAELEKSGPDYVTDPAKAIYRIYRDTRFSNDKTPYKTHIGALFPHRRLGKNGGAALYFHLSPKEFLIAAGIYHAPTSALRPVREHIAETHPRLTAILRAAALKRYFGGLQGDQLTRVPKGWPPDHPAAAYLRYKDLLTEVSLPPETALGKAAASELTKRVRTLIPFVDYLNEPYLKARRRDPLLD